MELLKSVALTGRTVVLSIHQPRNEILMIFDRLVLMNAGECAYYGSVMGAINSFRISAKEDDYGSALLSAIDSKPVAEQRRMAMMQRLRFDHSINELRIARVMNAFSIGRTNSTAHNQQRRHISMSASTASVFEEFMRKRQAAAMLPLTRRHVALATLPTLPTRSSVRFSPRIFAIMCLRAFILDLPNLPGAIFAFLLFFGGLSASFPNYTISSGFDAFVFVALVAVG